MNAKGTIVAFAPGVWRWPDLAGSTRYHLWTLAGRGWRVLYVDPPHKLSLMASTWKADDREFIAFSPGRVVPFAPRKAPDGSAGEKWRRRTSKQIADRTFSFLKGIGWEPDVYWFGAPWHSALMEELSDGPKTVFHVYDELCDSPAFTPEQQKRLWTWEAELIRGAQLTLCSSIPQLRRREKSARATALLENAVSEEFIAACEAGEPVSTPEPLPAEAMAELEKLRATGTPRVVYGGVVDARMDRKAVEALVYRFPQATFCFLGRIQDREHKEWLSELGERAGVFCSGELPFALYPALYAEADVLLLAHARTRFTNAMYPEKLNEYLAAGKPIVSVALPEVVRLRDEAAAPGVIRAAENVSELAELLQEALSDKDPALVEARRALARKHTWNAAADRLEELLDLR